ncbi:copper resistance CopC family protein [Corynebacterium massiliense]|uniref:copper resistance CopC family protein n=1 Tax=Corynebacterium massiliense TaxID=441501 RepID=UPI00235374E8|nr:copper resistance CopC family protein [Corynebacterium massiliense]
MALTRNRFRRSVAATACAFLGALGTASVAAPLASAHDVVVGGSVEEGKTYDEFPDTITLEFSAIPRDGFNTFAVQDKGSGETLFDAEPTIDGRNLTIDTPDDVHPGDGEYQVGYQITSSDGHATRGGVSFAVEGSGEGDTADGSATADRSAGENSAADANEDADAAESTNSALPWIVGVGAILAAGAVVVLLLGKQRAARDVHSERPERPEHPEDRA